MTEVPFDGNKMIRRDYNRYYWDKVKSSSVYVKIDTLHTKLKLVDIHTTGNGHAYAEWTTPNGITLYSSLREFKRILKTVTAVDGWYEGVYSFVKRGYYWSLKLSSQLTTADQLLTETQRKTV